MRQLIRTDGTVEEIPAPLAMSEYRKLIGAETLDTVSLRHLGRPLHVMLVDDHGYDVREVEVAPNHFERQPARARKPINDKATALYWANCHPGTTHKIVGDVVVVPDEDFA
jgi:hypothetical protein